jgi:putative DNA primase/helicase
MAEVFSFDRIVTGRTAEERAKAEENEKARIHLDENGNLPPEAEDSIALLFADRHAHELRYVNEWGQWFKFDGSRWVKDNTLNTFDRARVICREIAANSASKAVASAKSVAAVERLAKSDRRLAGTSDQWDSHHSLLNAVNASYDLTVGVERGHNPVEYITKKTACACAPQGTQHPLWSIFLDRVTNGNAELQGFLQRYIGYCCTGLTHEHVFVFAYGTGANGKSTFINTIAGIFGDYATTADMSTFLASNNERHPTDLAKLCGARLVVAQETEKGRRWDETKIKALTGGDRIAARFMRQDFFDFTPVFKLLISGNHKPRLANVDEAIRRRLLIVPFTVQIPVQERDHELPAKLRAEWPAILRWCINGSIQYQAQGLDPPKIVTEATDEYFDDQDTIKQWLEDRITDGGPHAFTSTGQLFSSWKLWCDERNLKPGISQALSDALADRGYPRKRAHGGVRGFGNLVTKTS